MQLALELLAPAKDKSIGISAVNCGADAVYIAGPSYGAREAAGNPISDIGELARYAHIYGTKVYITVNTILFDSELEAAQNIIQKAYQAGCDAVIAQDLSILKMDLPPIPIYASTQCNIRTPGQARFLESMGFQRLILERELSLEQIKAIREATSCELESFVHGALCVSYSGQCYLSQYLAGRSANRGCCIQACRSKYDLTDESGKVLIRDKALLSLKDLNLSQRIGDLVEAGITSFKIEGRLKNESYVKNIVRYYRSAIDSYLEGHLDSYCRASHGAIIGGFTPDPELTFSRGYTSLFIDGEKGQWSSMDTPKSIGEEVGIISKIISVDTKSCTFKFEPKPDLKYPVANGDGLCFVSDGNIIGMRADVSFGRTIITKCNPYLKEGLILYRNFNLVFEHELEKNMPSRFMDAKVYFFAKATTSDDELAYFHIEVEASAENGVSASVVLDEELPVAKHVPLTERNLENQFGKTAGHYSFRLESIKATVMPFIPLSRMNTIRRILAEKLDQAITSASLLHNAPKTEKTKVEPVLPQNLTPIPPVQTVRLNCSNHLSRSIYESLNVFPVPAYEVQPSKDMELMRTRYCIRHELGLCPKQGSFKATPLYLTNQGKRLQVSFDCAKCEMTVKAADKD